MINLNFISKKMKTKILACFFMLIGAFGCTMLNQVGNKTEPVEKLKKASAEIIKQSGAVIDGDTVRVYSRDSTAMQTIYLHRGALHVNSTVEIDKKVITALKLARLIEQMNRQEKQAIKRTIKTKSHE